MPESFWVETLGCPKNQVDSEKLTGTMLAKGMRPADSPDEADVVVVNTCAFIEAARQESVDTVMDLADQRHEGARIVVTGCMAERYGDELASTLYDEGVLGDGDTVSGFGVALDKVSEDPRHAFVGTDVASLDLLNLPRPRPMAPWAYLKVAEGCDRNCGFCAIPSFRGPQRSRSVDELVAEAREMDVREVVLVAQDLASYGRDQGRGDRRITQLVRSVADHVDWVRLLYLYPADLTDELVETIVSTGVPYFDLSLQHVSPPLMRAMRRWGDGEHFLERISSIRALEPGAAFRSNFIVGYPGETEADHDLLLEFVREARLDWCAFFAYSREEGTFAADLDNQVASELMQERLSELRELQDGITAQIRDELIGSQLDVLVEARGQARSFREAPEIDGVIAVPETLEMGTFARVVVVDAMGPDLVADRVGADSSGTDSVGTDSLGNLA